MTYTIQDEDMRREMRYKRAAAIAAARTVAQNFGKEDNLLSRDHMNQYRKALKNLKMVRDTAIPMARANLANTYMGTYFSWRHGATEDNACGHTFCLAGWGYFCERYPLTVKPLPTLPGKRLHAKVTQEMDRIVRDMAEEQVVDDGDLQAEVSHWIYTRFWVKAGWDDWMQYIHNNLFSEKEEWTLDDRLEHLNYVISKVETLLEKNDASSD